MRGLSGQHLVSGSHLNGRTTKNSAEPTVTAWARRVALMAAAALLAVPETANAQMFWNWGGPAYYYEPAPVKPKRPRIKRKDPAEAAARAAAKPVGPLVIAVSVEKQRVRVFDSNGLFAEAPVSTGTKSHPTPYGVFSIIQKNRHHVSNLYGASMPYMQRITWSGVAMHTGPLPGYAASHGCIRLPNDFAARLWTWTRMGTRVIVAPGEVAPSNFSHAKLVARMVPQPSVSSAPATTQVAAAGPMKAPAANRHAMAQQRTADAREALEGMKGMLSDVTPSAAPSEPATAEPAAGLIVVGIDMAGDTPQTLPGDARPEATAGTQADDDAQETAANTDDSEKPAQTALEIAKPADIATSPEVARPADVASPAATPEQARPVVTSPPRRHNHVAVFISRKDKRLYIRHGYEPVYDTPVEITDPDRPLGTHVLTARGDKDDAHALYWSVVSLPQVARKAAAQRTTRGTARKPVVAQSSVVPPLNAADALDRIAIPSEAVEKIASIITPGGSILISDHGLNGWETGKGTDFIVPLR